MTDLRDRPVETVDSLLAEKYEPIAIVGVGLRFPGGCDCLDDFEAFLREGRSGIRPLPDDRWDVAAFTPTEPGERGKIHTTGGGFLDRIDEFDAAFFNISPKEAQYIDPQQRILLETAWQALENANIDPTGLRRGNGGVYVGASSIDYALEIDALPYPELDGHLAAGITMFPLSGRLSYFLGWRGPSISVDTACSSSLAAMHMAVQGLRRRESDIALCAGVNALHHPRIPVIFSHGQMLAPDGQCKTFDESADGYVRAEGCGVVVLMRLSDALRDGRDVLAVIRGTAVGQDGDSAGLTVPNGAAQEQVIRQSLAAARLAPQDIGYVEAHGTGTPLGDPIEMSAINDVFAQSHSKQRPLIVGSVKTNLGHMEPASGIVGVIKAALQVRTATIYPHLNLVNPSGRIPWTTYPVEVPTTCREWTDPVRRAVVNSFGFAGTIAAVVLEQPPRPAPTQPAAPRPPSAEPVLFTLSAKGATALGRQVDSYRRYLADHPDVDIDRICHTSNVGRAHHSHRLSGVVADRAQLMALLDRAATNPDLPGPSGVRKVAFMFSGQGAQYAGMGGPLYRRFPVFRQHVDECDDLFATHLGRSVRALLLGEVDDPGEIDQTWLTQPALFTVEYALARLWMSWGIKPNVLIGHSIGEVVAATVAGLFSLPDAVLLVAHRGQLMQAEPRPGSMAAVQAPADEVEPLLAGQPDLALAAVNAPDQCVVSGDRGDLTEVVAQLRERGLRVEELTVSHAFHSPLMAGVSEEFRAVIAGITFHEPRITMVSNVTGAVARFAEVGTPDYWARHIRQPVQFLAGMRTIAKRGKHAMIEIGPSTTLSALAQRCVPVGDHQWAASASRRRPGSEVILRSLGALYTAGLSVAFAGVHQGRPTRPIKLPGYEFQRKRYWLPLDRSGSTGTASASTLSHHPLLGIRGTDTTTGDVSDDRWEFSADWPAGGPSQIDGHTVDGRVVMPLAGFVEQALAAMEAVFGHTGGSIRDLRIHTPLTADEEDQTTVHTRLRRTSAVAELVISTGHGDTETVHATAVLADDTEAVVPPGSATRDGEPDEVRDGTEVYTDLASVGRAYEPRVRLLRRVARHGDVRTGELANRLATPGELLPVEVLDAALQVATALDETGLELMPVSVGHLRLFRRPRGERVSVRAVVRYPGPVRSDDRGDPAGPRAEAEVDLLLFDGDKPVARLRRVGFAAAADADRRSPFVHRLRWLRDSNRVVAQPGARHVLLANADPVTAAELARTAGSDLTVTSAPDPDALSQALRGAAVTDVAWFWRGDDAPVSSAGLRAECERNYRSLLATVGAVDSAGLDLPPRLWLVTERAQWLPGDQPQTGERLAAASLWGFGTVLLTEYPQYRVTLVDLGCADDLAALSRELLAARPDGFQVALRSGDRHVRRLLAGEQTPHWSGDFEVRATDDERTETVPVQPVTPADDEIQVRMTVAVPRLAGLTPVACAGTVTRAGGVSGFAVGDSVVVPVAQAVRGLLTVAAARALPVPPGVDPMLAATAVAGDEPAGAALARLAAGSGGPLPREYELDEFDEALRVVRGGALPGAVAVTLPTGASAEPSTARVRPDRTYVITGGLGGLGVVTARKLVDLGARRLVLVSRSGRATPEAQQVLDELRGRAAVTLLRADIARPEDVTEMVEQLRASGQPVGGFVHAAGAIGKELIAKLTWEAIDEQLGPKVYGGWLLHEASRHFPEHDLFVAYSSIAAVIGGATQAHYAAASAFLDGLAQWRSRQGLPGLSVNWGAWAHVGMSARLDEQFSREIDRSGIRFFSPGRALTALAGLWGRGTDHRVLGQYDWDRIAAGSPLDNTLYAHLIDPTAVEDPGADLRQRLRAPDVDRRALLDGLVAEKVAAALHLDDPRDLDTSVEFVSLGLDSLMAVELKTSLETLLRIPLPASLIFDHPSPRQLAEFLDRQLAIA